MFVNHLRHRVAQQNHILIKGFNLPLQLDTVDQINGNRNMLTTKCVEEGILKELAFIIHDIFRVEKLNKR